MQKEDLSLVMGYCNLHKSSCDLMNCGYLLVNDQANVLMPVDLMFGLVSCIKC